MSQQDSHNTLQNDGSESGQDVVLLVHGTFAGSNDDDGDAWWQRGSGFWNDLQQEFGDSGAVCVEMFHWSGANSEIARQQAATGLLHKLIHPKARGQRFHLVGHSHGGSVIWLALKMADFRSRLLARNPTAQINRLDNVRTWSTLGTPFISYQRLSVGWWLGWCTLFVVLGTLTIGLLRWCGFAATDGIPLKYWWTLIPLGVATLMLTAIGFLDPIWRHFQREQDRRALDRFGDRWLGIWSRQDEAIQGLRESLTLRWKTATKREHLRRFHGVNEEVQGLALDPALMIPHIISTLLRVPIRILSVPFNPIATYLFWSKLRKMIQGNDLSFRAVNRVEPSPVPNVGNALHEDLDRHLVDVANQHATALVPHFRQSLGQTESPALGGTRLMDAVIGDFSGAGLIHNSYYNHPDVRALLVTHIRQSLRNPPPSTRRPLREELRQWYEAFGQSVSTTIAPKEAGTLDS